MGCIGPTAEQAQILCGNTGLTVSLGDALPPVSSPLAVPGTVTFLGDSGAFPGLTLL